MAPPRARRVLVTVGTTRFDALVRAAAAPDVEAALVARGYTALRIQVGRGAAPASWGPEAAADDADAAAGADGAATPGFRRSWFRFTPDLATEIVQAALVVSHAGAGSIMEALAARAPLVVVANDALMDNHQSELALELQASGHVVVATPKTLADAIRRVAEAPLVPYPAVDDAAFAKLVDAEVRTERPASCALL
ncbi:glycosyl transferase [Pelagophyceae sp. CCMP2097]|nr:glycosyl transferase [Pelagophyceae sp. CCMP2097]